MLAGGLLLSACGTKGGAGVHGSSSTALPPAATPASSTTANLAPTTTLAPIATFSVTWSEANCPPGTPDTTSCYANTGTADIAGLGPATESYTLLAEGSNPSCGGWRADVAWTVAGKGTIEFTIKSPRCQSLNSPNGTTNYIVTGGSGAYKGVSGSGTVDSTGHETAPGRGTGTDRWTGTLSALSNGTS